MERVIRPHFGQERTASISGCGTSTIRQGSITSRPLRTHPRCDVGPKPPHEAGDSSRLTRGPGASKVYRMVKLSSLDRTLSAISDGTRREILERRRLGPASITDLAASANITLPGVMKHVRLLEQARLVTTQKSGRVRECRLGPAR